jgi:hypothetical protein
LLPTGGAHGLLGTALVRSTIESNRQFRLRNTLTGLSEATVIKLDLLQMLAPGLTFASDLTEATEPEVVRLTVLAPRK